MINLAAILTTLAHERPVFHSEADFQHALAWKIHESAPEARIRLECRPLPDERLYLDILLRTREAVLAIELKYLVRGLSIEIAEEAFRLAPRGAQPHGRYDFLKDLTRLERIVTTLPGSRGTAILLTNDKTYWSPTTRVGGVDAAFRVHEGRTVTGNLRWADHTGGATMRGREAPLDLRGPYNLRWRDFSDIGGDVGRFRYLLVPVA